MAFGTPRRAGRTAFDTLYERLLPGPGEVIVGTADGPVAVKRPPSANANTIVFLGDSITSVSGAQRSDAAYRDWAVLLTNGQVVDAGGQYATGGHTAEQVRDEFVPQVLALDPLPDIANILIGTNNSAANDPVGTFTVIRDGIYKPLQDAGITVIANGLVPRADAVPFVTHLTQLIANHAAQTGMPFCNHMVPAMTDPTTGGLRASLALDTIHPNRAGHKIMGANLAAVLTAVAGPWSPPLVVSDADTSSFFSRPCFTAGFTDANGDGLPDASGGRVRLYFFNGASDVSVSYEDGTPDGVAGRWLVLTKTGAGSMNIFSDKSQTVSPGDVIEFGCALEVENAQADTQAGLYLSGGNSSSHRFGGKPMMALSQWGANIGPTRHYGRAVIPDNLVSTTLRLNIELAGAAGTVLRVGQLTARNLTALGLA